MRQKGLNLMSCLIVVALMVLARPALAFEDVGDDGGRSGRFGVGVEALLPTLARGTPAGAAAFSYDAGAFRIDGLLGVLFVEDASTAFTLGGRFMYVLAHSRNADFSLGGGISFNLVDPNGPADSQVNLALEGGFQIRVFLATNVALTGTAGLGFAVGDGPFLFGIGGQVSGGLGLLYYF